MEQDYSTTGIKKYAHLSEKDRYKIEALLEIKKSAKEIAVLLGRDRSTIHREIRRGTIKRIQTDLTQKKKYRANVAQADYVRRCRNRERPLKIGRDRLLEEHIRTKLVQDRFSPDAIIGQIKARGLIFKGLICTKTLYNYIDAGIFSGITNELLWQKRTPKKRRYKPVGRIVTANRLGKSIENRPKEADNRLEYGHWEGDSLKGPTGFKTSLITLTERKTRQEIILKVEQATQRVVKKALDDLEKEHGSQFRAKFKSITFDNGVEFLDWKSLEISVLNPVESRTAVYFAHAYSSWERGTNENHNRMIRRFIPKGTDIASLGDKDIRIIQDWMNNYPRRILGYNTPSQAAARESLQGSRDLKPPIVAI